MSRRGTDLDTHTMPDKRRLTEVPRGTEIGLQEVLGPVAGRDRGRTQGVEQGWIGAIGLKVGGGKL